MESAVSEKSKVELSGEVICRDIANPRAVNRFVQKWIGRWVALRGLDARDPGAYFHVIFTREGGGHNVDCEMRLRIGNQLWTGSHYGTTIAEALRQCLEHMNPLNSLKTRSLGAPLLSAATR